MKRLPILLGIVASTIAPVYATPIQPQNSDFKLERWISQQDERAPSKYPLINIRVRYMGESELSVAPIGMAPHQIFLGTPQGWQARPLSGVSGYIGQANIPMIKKGQFMDALVPLDFRFSKIQSGTVKVPIRVIVRSFEGKWTFHELTRKLGETSALKPLKPVTLTGFVTITIPAT